MTTNKAGVFYIPLYLVGQIKWMLMLMPLTETGGELLHGCQREEQESPEGGRDEDVTERRQDRSQTETIDVVYSRVYPCIRAVAIDRNFTTLA